MKLTKPQGTLTQPFGVNYNSSYISAGLKAHPGQDYVTGWKQNIIASATGKIYSILNEHNPNTDKYRAIYQIVFTNAFEGETCYEVSYGHIDTSLVKEGDFVRAGTPIGTEGNYGLCFVGGVQVRPDEKPTGKGSHLHFQVRKCKFVSQRKKGYQYLRSSEGLLKVNDLYCEVVDYDNGYNGCIDPSPFYEGNINRVMELGEEGEHIIDLQKKLNKLGFFFADYYPRYGVITRNAVYNFQLRYVPMNWYEKHVLKGRIFGEKSIRAINSL